ncbi:hypothetical protein AFK68_13290 [Hydrocoleum sp. CS-953]|uniref:DUF928 domain-containing protein n=1 Tax=Hydrocoleum sp. CS-953 TaxID=1671698 RepID=UPI000B9B888F|nr:DUF928 domain-containing protein [Hydrocoleum sp. CS-953]OZH54071.1 hypothetical protein AFK68_13290 [Hydrocoleum sp. CS-953]
MNIYQKNLLSSLKLKTLVLTLLFLGLSTISLSRNTLANITPRTDRGTGDTVPGGTRGSCFYEGQKPLTPLTPKTNNRQVLTLASHPTIFIYVPENTAIAGEFILKDSTQKKVYEDIVLLPDSQGIIGIKIPTDQPELKVGKNYNWTFSLICETPIPEAMVEGSIQRVNPSADLTTKLQKTPESDRWLIYSEAGIWYEALVTLAELIRSNPNDVKFTSEWQNLLNSVGLNEVATEPLKEP